MSEREGLAGGEPRPDIPKSRLAEYAEMAGPTGEPVQSAPPRPETPAEPGIDSAVPASAEDPLVTARRLEFTALLERFRSTAVLVPLAEGPSPDAERGLLTADLNGIRFILAFSDRQALARYAQARGEFHREWTYQTVLGARLLDVAVPAAGVPCGVALDCADGPGGVIFPPVKGIVPDGAAVDGDTTTTYG
ncbi:hypothetical protein ACFWVT_07295 [Streptomyces cyaneofuscatus]|uniref:hypothetical protein n=1 Tax=Streptomyces cyaneofuscatus TaxID=66883 RepID=UPI003648F1EB